MADQFRRKALLGELGVGDDSGNTGIAGTPDVSQLAGPPPVANAPAMPASPLADAPVAAAPETPDYTKMGKYGNALTGYNMDKFNRPYDQQSEKYKVGLVNSHFDPNQGITPEYLAALKGLNIADFSGSGDKLTAMNGRNGGRYGAGGTSDTVVGLHSGGNAKWGAWTDPALEAAAAQQGPQAGGAPAFGGMSLDSALNGDPLAKIKEAIAAMSAGRPNAAALMQQLGGGQ